MNAPDDGYPILRPNRVKVANIPDCVLDVCIGAARQHMVGQIFEITHASVAKMSVEHEIMHPLGVLTWTVMFSIYTTSGTFFWATKVSAGAADDIQPGELSDVKLSVYFPERDSWDHVLTYKHPFSTDNLMWLNTVTDPYSG